MLDLSSPPAQRYETTALQPIARLQQLTELRLGRVRPSQLLAVQLPNRLQQLDVTVDVEWDPQALLGLADWLRQYGCVVRYLRLLDVKNKTPSWPAHEGFETQMWFDAMVAVADALESAEAPLAAVTATHEAGGGTANSAAEGTLAVQHAAGAASCNSWRMQTLCCHPGSGPHCAIGLPGLLFQQLPAATLTQLVCGLHFHEPQHLAALCGLTALRSLRLLPVLFDVVECSSSVLSPMSALRQLTALHVERVSVQQLAQLQLPQLRRLDVSIRSKGRAALADHQQQDEEDDLQDSGQLPQLQLGHLTSLTYLDCSGKLLPLDELPVSLRSVKCYIDYVPWMHDVGIKAGAYSMQPLLKLSLLEELDMNLNKAPPALEELQQLTCLQQLKVVRYQDHAAGACLATMINQAWGALALTRLELHGSTGGSGSACT
uniref:Uncharacterized protein n=1 Tax=Tetradesmus obliquus TaxID=3088 RepID=A0A383W2D8_TETOB|eukprot:jgi/Sobl393_1/17570/SZX71390.1